MKRIVVLFGAALILATSGAVAQPEIKSASYKITKVHRYEAQVVRIATRTLLRASRATIVLDEWANPPEGKSNDCQAAVWGLQAHMGEPSLSSPPQTGQVVEAEVWFIHTAPDGKETTQRPNRYFAKHSNIN